MTHLRPLFRLARTAGLAAVLVPVASGCSPGARTGGRPAASSPASSAPAPTAPRPLEYVAVGASETVGYGTPRPEEQAWPQVFARTALPPGTSVVNLGISGATVGEALAREVPEAVAARPDVVTVWLNVNDLVAAVAPATYEGELGQLVHALRDGGRTTVLVANTPALDRLPAYLACRPNPPPSSPPCLVGRDQLPSPAVVDLAVDAYNRAVAAVAAREGAVLVDLHAALDAARQAGREADLVGPDGFHPSVAGHEMVAAAFAAAYRSRLATSSSAVAPRT